MVPPVSALIKTGVSSYKPPKPPWNGTRLGSLYHQGKSREGNLGKYLFGLTNSGGPLANDLYCWKDLGLHWFYVLKPESIARARPWSVNRRACALLTVQLAILSRSSVQ